MCVLGSMPDRLQQSREFVVRESFGCRDGLRVGWLFALGQQGERTRHLRPQPGEEPKRVGGRNPKPGSGPVPLGTLRQQTLEEWKA